MTKAGLKGNAPVISIGPTDPNAKPQIYATDLRRARDAFNAKADELRRQISDNNAKLAPMLAMKRDPHDAELKGLVREHAKLTAEHDAIRSGVKKLSDQIRAAEKQQP